MGITICSKHGRQQIRFASQRLADQARRSGDAATDPILLLKLRCVGLWWTVAAYADFFLENSLSMPTSGVLLIEDEEQAEDLVNRLESKVVPVCEACLQAFINENAPAHIVGEFSKG